MLTKEQFKRAILACGLDPENDKAEISGSCYNAALDELKERFGEEFANFFASSVNAVDDMFYLKSYSWNSLYNSYLEFIFDETQNPGTEPN